LSTVGAKPPRPLTAGSDEVMSPSPAIGRMEAGRYRIIPCFVSCGARVSPREPDLSRKLMLPVLGISIGIG
ncbi:MAG: hypothetical protein ACYTFQ_23120, partial [Planctomycetota bacterium]